MNIIIWVVQVLAGLAFVMSGIIKITRPIDKLAEQMMPWAAEVPPWLVRFIGVAELLGGIGLILPAATGVLPWLTPVAAIALAVIMLLAAGFHTSRKDESWRTIPSLVLLVLVVIIVVGRFAISPL